MNFNVQSLLRARGSGAGTSQCIPTFKGTNANDDPVTSIMDVTYPNILYNINDPSYFQEKYILAPTNEVVDTINDHLLEKFPGEETVYLSCDNIDTTKHGVAVDQSIFSPEFMNKLKL
ncbi:ATP-dependent DNA helicase PIF1-like protein [Tanacetum coccineum]